MRTGITGMNMQKKAEFYKWDIYWAKVEYEENSNIFKVRPVLIIDKFTAYILALKITKQSPRYNFEGEYEIQKWKEANLPQPSTIRISKKIKLDPNDLKEWIGQLRPIDRRNVENIMKQIEDQNL